MTTYCKTVTVSDPKLVNDGAVRREKEKRKRERQSGLDRLRVSECQGLLGHET